MTDVDSGKLLENQVIYALRTIKNPFEAEDFLRGYILDVEINPNKYPEQAKDNPSDYAIYDTLIALSMHFHSRKTHKLWKKAIENYSE